MRRYDGRKVLVIEPDREAAEEIRDMLKYLGYQPGCAHCAYTGLLAARRLRPDFVLCATSLEGMNGFQAAEELRRLPETARARLIALIDFRAGTLDGAKAASCFDFHLFRPVTLARLREALAADDDVAAGTDEECGERSGVGPSCNCCSNRPCWGAPSGRLPPDRSL